jgi:hypothetical protein
VDRADEGEIGTAYRMSRNPQHPSQPLQGLTGEARERGSVDGENLEVSCGFCQPDDVRPVPRSTRQGSVEKRDGPGIAPGPFDKAARQGYGIRMARTAITSALSSRPVETE